MQISNSYDDQTRAEAYARLEFPGTYYLGFRDLPTVIRQHVCGHDALDFGCGTGRSTRFLRGLGFDVIGIDIAAPMIEQARMADPLGQYVLVGDANFRALKDRTFDLILSTFAFDNIAGRDHRIAILQGLADLLRDDGRIILVVCAPDVYVNEWVSFTTRDFPENRHAGSGDQVRGVMTDVADRRPVVDFLWFHEDYLDLFAATNLGLVACHRPLGRDGEPYVWVTERSIAPFALYVLHKGGADASARTATARGSAR